MSCLKIYNTNSPSSQPTLQIQTQFGDRTKNDQKTSFSQICLPQIALKHLSSQKKEHKPSKKKNQKSRKTMLYCFFFQKRWNSAQNELKTFLKHLQNDP